MTTSWERFQRHNLRGNVVLNFTTYPKGDLAVYGLAYREAADRLVEAFKAREWYSDADACPIVFLYRHAIELYMKHIILWGAGLVRLQSSEELSTDMLLNTHSLEELLPALTRVFKEAGWMNVESGAKFGTLKEIKEFIHVIDEIDPKSFAFRYPVDTKGEAHLPEKFTFNVVALAEEASAMLRSLDGAAMGVYEIFQNMASICREAHLDLR
jgi:hypothetical protein